MARTAPEYQSYKKTKTQRICHRVKTSKEVTTKLTGILRWKLDQKKPVSGQNGKI